MKKQAVIDFEKSIATIELPKLAPGDTVSVFYRINEGGKERIQVYKGVVVALRGEGMGEHFTVRKLTQGHGVERSFPVQSPFIEKVVVERRGKVSRAKLFYLRDRTGKATRIEEKIEVKKV
jgi:large subunit ribosomal protein L19